MISGKKSLSILVFVLLSINTSFAFNEDGSSDPYLKLAHSIENYAKKFVSTPYSWGGKKPGAFDCSGLVQYCFRQFGMPLTQSSTELAKMGYEIPPLGAMPGDLIFFKRSKHGKSPVSHVGIVLEVNEKGLKFIHAARNQGVITSYLSETYYTEHFVSVKRVLDGLKNFKYS